MEEAILSWLLKVVLNWATAKAETELSDAAALKQRDEERGITDAANVVKYTEAKTRAERIAAATDLLNRNRG